MTYAPVRPNTMSSTEMLERLVAFPTVSAESNLDCVHFIADYLAGHGIRSTLVHSEDGAKANLFATIGPNVPGGVVLSGHTDVVPPQKTGWTGTPWRLHARDGRLYGRGACDMKGFDAAVLAAVPDMVAAKLRAPIHIALSYDEEVGCKGAPSLVRAMIDSIATPQAVIVGEPTMMSCVTGHKGSLSFFTEVTGHAVHSSRIDIGVSAVMVAARLVTWLWDTMEANRRAADPDNLFEPPYTTLHCGMIQGGTAANIVASSCSFVTDIRAIPTDDPWEYQRRYLAFIADSIEPTMKASAPSSGVSVIHRSMVPGLLPEQDGAAARLVHTLTGSAAEDVVSYGTEAGIFQEAGWSTVVCGPGNIAQAHQPDEWLAEEQLAAAGTFVRRLIDHLS